MIYVDENVPKGDEPPQFEHRTVAVQRPRDVNSEYEMLDEIGRGKFGRVMRCKHLESGQFFAAKFVFYTKKDDRANVEREVEIMNTLKHPKLLYLYEAYDNGRNEMCLVTEYIGGGELFDRVIEDEFVLTEKACVAFMRQIVEGVSFMHQNQIIHLDLKPENILCLTKHGNRIKIIDFGLARVHQPHKTLQVMFGTPEFVAPEVVNFEPISYSTDMWAVGVIAYVLLSGLSPFMGDNDLETMANVTIAEYDYEDEAFDSVSKIAKDFIDKLLVKKKEKRMSAESCLKHPWLQIPDDKAQNDDDALSANKHKRKETSKSISNKDYYFDLASKTMSVADDGGDDWEWEWYETQPVDKNDDSKEKPASSSSLTKPKERSSKADPVITHQQVQDKAAEMRSPVFAQIKTMSADCSTETASPLQSLPPSQTSDQDQVNPPDEDDNETVYSAEISRPVQIVLSKTNDNNSSNMVAETSEQPPVWQAAERTLSPPWDVAKLTSNSLAKTTAIAEVKPPPSQQFYPRAPTPPRSFQLQQQHPHHPQLQQPQQQNNMMPQTYFEQQPQQNLKPLNNPALPPRSPPQRMKSIALQQQQFHQPMPFQPSSQFQMPGPIKQPQPQTKMSSNFQPQLSFNQPIQPTAAASGKKRRSDDCSSTSDTLQDHVVEETPSAGQQHSKVSKTQCPVVASASSSEIAPEKPEGNSEQLVSTFRPPAERDDEKIAQPSFNNLQSLVDLTVTSSTITKTAASATSTMAEEGCCEAAAVANKSSSDLIREADERIRFSINFDARKNQQQNQQPQSQPPTACQTNARSCNSTTSTTAAVADSNSNSGLKDDLSKVRQEISELKNDLSTTKQPLMDILRFLESPSALTANNFDHKQENVTNVKPKDPFQELLETQAELERLTSSITAFQSDLKTSPSQQNPPKQFSRQVSFGSANTGSVVNAKKMFEKKLDEEVENLTSASANPGFHTHHFSSPFRSILSTTPTAALTSVRRRSPSPVRTGNVSRARMRFESGDQPKQEPAFAMQPLSNNQTLPRTFRPHQMSPKPRPAAPAPPNPLTSSINRILTGSASNIQETTNNSRYFGGINKYASPSPSPFANISASSPAPPGGYGGYSTQFGGVTPAKFPPAVPQRRSPAVEGAARFLTESIGAKTGNAPSRYYPGGVRGQPQPHPQHQQPVRGHFGFSDL